MKNHHNYTVFWFRVILSDVDNYEEIIFLVFDLQTKFKKISWFFVKRGKTFVSCKYLKISWFSMYGALSNANILHFDNVQN